MLNTFVLSFCSCDVIKIASLNQIPAWLSGSANLMRRQADKQEIVVHVVGGRAQHQDPPGPVSEPREDLQAMKHESQVGGCSQNRGRRWRDASGSP